jgi:hypothetical protein
MLSSAASRLALHLFTRKYEWPRRSIRSARRRRRSSKLRCALRQRRISSIDLNLMAALDALLRERSVSLAAATGTPSILLQVGPGNNPVATILMNEAGITLTGKTINLVSQSDELNTTGPPVFPPP